MARSKSLKYPFGLPGAGFIVIDDGCGGGIPHAGHEVPPRQASRELGCDANYERVKRSLYGSVNTNIIELKNWARSRVMNCPVCRQDTRVNINYYDGYAVMCGKIAGAGTWLEYIEK